MVLPGLSVLPFSFTVEGSDGYRGGRLWLQHLGLMQMWRPLTPRHRMGKGVAAGSPNTRSIISSFSFCLTLAFPNGSMKK